MHTTARLLLLATCLPLTSSCQRQISGATGELADASASVEEMASAPAASETDDVAPTTTDSTDTDTDGEAPDDSDDAVGEAPGTSNDVGETTSTPGQATDDDANDDSLMATSDEGMDEPPQDEDPNPNDTPTGQTGDAGAPDDSSTTEPQSTDDSSAMEEPGTTDEPENPTPDDSATNPNRIRIKGKDYYLNGINVAWNQWEQDLTNYDSNAFEQLFSTLEASGGNAVRWWWFPTAGQQLSFNGNQAQPLQQRIFDNLDRAFDSAANHGILIMPVLLSFDIESTGRVSIVTDQAATDAFVSNVVTPLVQRYDSHPGLGLWEIMNEGDWLLTDEGGPVAIADYQRFHGKVAAGIHAAAADAIVTTGSASFKFLESNNNILSDTALQAAVGGDPMAHLDVYQTHYYGWQHGTNWSYEPWIRTSAEWQSDGKPVLIGEFPCAGEAGRWTTMQMHTESVNQGYAGTFCWAYYDNRADDEGTWNEARPAMEAIADQIPGAIVGE
jgi:hypothetical protein